MKRTAAFLILIFSAIPAINAQGTMENILSEIERNNTTLQALRQQLEARRLENRTGIFLPDPEAEFNYLWGNPSVMGNRIDIALTQSFDFPTAYSYRRQISGARNQQLELEYKSRLKDILYQARLIMTDIVYFNNRKAEYARRLEHASDIAASFQVKLDLGETGLPDYNKAQLNLLNIEKELEIIETELATFHSELAALNGGNREEITIIQYEQKLLPDEFTQWYHEAEKENPVLQWLAMETQISRKQENLSNALTLPRMHAGYMSETIGAEQFRGITAGITIPLWESRNTVRLAKAQTLAMQEAESDNKLQFYYQMQSQYEKAISLQRTLEGYRGGLTGYDNTDMLKTAMEMGEISLIGYITELSFYYDSLDLLMETEKAFYKAIASLYRYY